MPASEIKELRKSGKLEEALNMAYSEYEANPDNIWAKRNLSWVYWDYLKQSVGQADEFLEYLEKIKALELSSLTEPLLFEQLSWTIGMHLRQLSPMADSSVKLLATNVFRSIQDEYFLASKGFSFLIGTFHKIFKPVESNKPIVEDTATYLEFIDWLTNQDWDDYSCFMPEDYQPSEYKGKRIMALVEQIYIAYSKELLKGELPPLEEAANDDPESGRFQGFRKPVVNQTRVNDFLPHMDHALETNPELHFVRYFKVKLLIELGQIDEARSFILPFIKVKPREFWVWDLFGDLNKDSFEDQIACFYKAISLSKDEKFLIKVRQKLAKRLVELERYPEAKDQIDIITQTREAQNWRLTAQLADWQNAVWFVETKSNQNKSLVNRYISRADGLLYHDRPEIAVAIEFVNSNKSMLQFIHSKEKSGFLNYKGFEAKPKIGEVWMLRLEPIGEDGYHKWFTARRASQAESTNLDSIKTVHGKVDIPSGKDFAFVEGIFVPPPLVKASNLENGASIEAVAVQSYNKSKKMWGWKVVQLKVAE